MKNSKEGKMTRGITDEELRSRVKALAGLGPRQEQICSIVGIRSPKTLRKRFARELSVGVVEARAKVMHAAYKSAMSGRDPRMTIFWLKTRARWSEKASPEADLRGERYITRPYVSRLKEPPKAGLRNVIVKHPKPQATEPDAAEGEGDSDENE